MNKKWKNTKDTKVQSNKIYIQKWGGWRWIDRWLTVFMGFACVHRNEKLPRYTGGTGTPPLPVLERLGWAELVTRCIDTYESCVRKNRERESDAAFRYYRCSARMYAVCCTRRVLMCGWLREQGRSSWLWQAWWSNKVCEKMRLSTCVSVLRPVGPVVIGISLGFTLSLLSVHWVDESCHLDAKDGDDIDISSPQDGTLKGARKPSSISTCNDADSQEGFEPRVVPYKQVQQSPPQETF